MSDPAPTSTLVGKLKRSYLLHYIDATFGSSQTPSWFLIGKDIDDMSVELNPDTSKTKNILDETVVNDNGYEPTMSAKTYYANTGDAIYPKVKDIAMNRKTGDECKTKVLEVLVDTVEGLTGGANDAWVEDCIVKPQSYGGAPGGVNIPYNVEFSGNRQKGTATLSNRVPTFSVPSA